MYAYGQYVKQDFARSLELFDGACNAKHSTSCNLSGILLKDGLVGKIDLEKASYYFSKACDLGNEEGCRNDKVVKTRIHKK